MFAELFVLLYAAHLTADYALQTDHQAEHKAACGAAGWRANLAHSLTHAAMYTLVLVVAVLVLEASVTIAAGAVAVVAIAGLHGAVDRRWPVRWWMENTGSASWYGRGGAAHVDQTAHVVVLVIAALVLAA
ncbi:DUF3307 domain-containing protein [Streptomyces uncialis]|uniref:DUF3307 domain-containing protein n=1 Tax=Streptomyces uncialis TaxID=1048205 RepID=UPI00225B9375|nr:DUF3307 domain-containing protein [Streptomyces uncialis]MCX4665053.1 DUF3307 domain-containing protein [Streptomyces uncialis]